MIDLAALFQRAFEAAREDLVALGGNVERVYTVQARMLEEFRRIGLPLADAQCALLGCLAELTQIRKDMYLENCN